jgi:roadblock/LC7 domain-containing protein
MLVIAMLACAAGPLAAQADPKATLLADWQRLKDNNLHYLDAMPDSGLAFHPTPGVRTFAEQMEHIVSTNADVAALAVKGLAATPAFGDTAQFLHNKAALHRHVAEIYDYMIAAIRDATPAQLSRVSAMYGQPAAPATRWLQLSLEHSVWTLGQTVPYLRLNRIPAPSYSMPF